MLLAIVSQFLVFLAFLPLIIRQFLILIFIRIAVPIVSIELDYRIFRRNISVTIMTQLLYMILRFIFNT